MCALRGTTQEGGNLLKNNPISKLGRPLQPPAETDRTAIPAELSLCRVSRYDKTAYSLGMIEQSANTVDAHEKLCNWRKKCIPNQTSMGSFFMNVSSGVHLDLFMMSIDRTPQRGEHIHGRA